MLGLLLVSVSTLATAFLTDLPPILLNINKLQIDGDAPSLIAPTIVTGPSPDSLEDFKKLRLQGGIKRIGYYGNTEVPDYLIGKGSANQLELLWKGTESNDNLFYDHLKANGPWYMYGPDLIATHLNLIRLMFQPRIPNLITAYPEQKEHYTDLKKAIEVPSVIAHCPTCINSYIPDEGKIFLFASVFTLYTILAAVFVGWLHKVKNVRVAYTRKIFHLIIFSLAGMIQIIWSLPLVILFGSIVFLSVIYAVSRGEGFPFYDALARPKDAPRKSFFITFPLITTALGGLLSNIFFGSWAAIGIVICGWGDATGEIIGSRYGKHTYKVPTFFGVPAIRTVEGSISIFLVSILVSVPVLIIFGLTAINALIVGAITAFIGTVIEALSTHGLDNLTIQLATTATAYYLAPLFQ